MLKSCIIGVAFLTFQQVGYQEQSPHMNVAIILSMAVVSRITCIPEKPCNRLKIDETWYDIEILWADLGKPYNLNIHKGSNTLFFSYTVPETYADVDFQLASFNIDTKEYQTIAGIRGGCSVAIDQANDDVYLGGSDGIYKYNMVTKIADFYKEEGVNIWALFHRRNLFYISYPDQRLHMEIDGRFAAVKEFDKIEIDHFYVHNNNVIYFANKTGLYKYNNNLKSIEIINDLITVRQIVEDNDGNMYICTNLGLFVDRKNELKKVLDMRNIQGLAFDKENHFVLSDEKSVMKLIRSNIGCLDTNEDHW